MNNFNSKATIYFPGLNGLRAIAALAVVVSHITLALGNFGLNPGIFGTYPDGKPKSLFLASYGVTIFFVISGFLITYLLQIERHFGSINIRKFYLRRILRIWPLYYLYLIIALLLILFVGWDINNSSILYYVFFAANIPFIADTAHPLIIHFWSLGVEEQFYLIWPWVNKGKRLIYLVFFLIILLVSAKTYLHFAYPGSVAEKAIHVTRFHCMMIGGLGALLYKEKNKLFLLLADNKITQLICWGILFLVAINKYHLISFLDEEFISVVALVVIIGQINITNRLINLDIPLMDFLGKISFGLYVIHPLLIFIFVRFAGNIVMPDILKYIFVYVVIIGTSVIVASLSYNYFEKYFLRFKKKFEVVKSAASRK